MTTPRLQAPSLPLALVRSLEQRGLAWPRVSEVLDLREGMACVVAVSDDGWPDRVRLIVRHADRAMGALAVLAWRTREPDRENPSWQ
jgi:hypothetical protein